MKDYLEVTGTITLNEDEVKEAVRHYLRTVKKVKKELTKVLLTDKANEYATVLVKGKADVKSLSE